VAGTAHACAGEADAADGGCAAWSEEEGVEEEAVAEDLEEEAGAGDLPPLPSRRTREVSVTRAPLPHAVRPNTVCFNTCIHAWASSDRGREGARRAEELLHQLEALSGSGELDLPGDADAPAALRPDVRTYALVMHAWTRVAGWEAARGGGGAHDAAARGERILDRMEARAADGDAVRPNLVAYVTAIAAWARTAAAAGTPRPGPSTSCTA
jgi:hypothetical protein